MSEIVSISKTIMPMKLSVKYIYSTIWHVSLLSEEFMIRNYQLLIRGTHEHCHHTK